VGGASEGGVELEEGLEQGNRLGRRAMDERLEWLLWVSRKRSEDDLRLDPTHRRIKERKALRICLGRVLEKLKDGQELGRTYGVDVDLPQRSVVGRADDAHDLSELVVVVSASEERVAEDHLRHAVRKGTRIKEEWKEVLGSAAFGGSTFTGRANAHMQPALQISMLVE
jgi:hypothetical protein